MSTVYDVCIYLHVRACDLLSSADMDSRTEVGFASVSNLLKLYLFSCVANPHILNSHDFSVKKLLKHLAIISNSKARLET